MSHVIVAQEHDSARAVHAAIEELGLAFVDLVKNARAICIVSTGTAGVTHTIVDAIRFHSRTPVHVLSLDDEHDTVEASIPRGEGVRMPVRRPRAVIYADVVISLTSISCIDQFLFHTWYAPVRQTAQGLVRTHAPWLEGELQNAVLADLYAQKPVTLAFLDLTSTAGFVLAGFDAVAVDSVGMHVRGISPEDVGYLTSLSAQGFGTCTLSKIDVPLGVISG